MATSFVLCLILFLGVGVLAVRYKKNNNEDYLLAGRALPSWMAGLSALATTTSGFMFTGWIGLTFTMGLSAMWFMVGFVGGSYLSLRSFAASIRDVSNQRQVLTYGGLLSRYFGEKNIALRRLVALVTFVFMASYAAAQLTAGSKALHVLFGWNMETGAVLGTLIIVIYCFTGGLRASVWTDTIQAVVMTLSMLVLLIAGLVHMGGLGALFGKLGEIDPNLVKVLPQNAKYGPLLYIMGWLSGGFAVSGQPQVMVRFMSMNPKADMNRAITHFMAWYLPFYLISFVVGLTARAYLVETSGFDPELALPGIADAMLPNFMVGLILAGLFAASMSTADSLVLGCSAAVARDCFPESERPLRYTKAATLTIAALVLIIAVSGNKSVFALVTFAWAGMGAAFVPLLLVYKLDQRPTQALSMTMMIVGIGVSVAWKLAGWSGAIFECLPGIAAAMVVFGVGRLLGHAHSGAKAASGEL